MKQITLLFSMLIALTASAATGWYNDFLTIKVNGVETTNNYYLVDADPASGASALHGASFGTVTGLELTAWDMKYWSDTQDRLGGALYYKIMNADGTSQIVAPVELMWEQVKLDAANDYQGIKPAAMPAINFLQGLPTGTYQLHVWAKSWGSNQGDSWLSNGSLNYVASFSVVATPTIGGTYKVGTTSGADYPSLSAAVSALNAATITSDVVFEITSDITEASNFGLAKDMGTFKLTIRPDADEDRTITFTQATANPGPFGHFVIGFSNENLETGFDGDLYTIETNNITIDGFAATGATRRLKLSTNSDALTSSAIITIVGGCSNITLKNLFIENNSTSNSARGLYLLTRKGALIDAAPNNLLLENNIFNISNSNNGTAISCNRSNSASTLINNLIIRKNKITSPGTGIEIHYSNGAFITENEFISNKGTGTGTAYGVWLRGSAGVMEINKNKFTNITSAQASGTGGNIAIFEGALTSGPFTLNITNNFFSGIDRTGTAGTINQAYIGSGQNSIETNIFNNTFYLPALSQPNTAGYYNAIRYTTTTRKAKILNNIFISNEDAKSQFINEINTAESLDYNIYFLRAGNTNARIVSTFATLEAYQTANNTKDINSKSVNVNFVDEATGNLLLSGLSVQDVNLKVPSLTAVTTDILGTTRNTEFTYAGAHEAALPFATTSVEKPKNNGNLTVTRQGIEIRTSEATRIEIYTTNGLLINKAIVNGFYSVALEAGVYIVRINDTTRKIVK